MKIVDIQGRNFSKIVCGSNPFYGHSHFSGARNSEYLGRFSDAAIADTIRFCRSKGVNTVESCANERICGIISSLKTAAGPVRFIGTTRIDETSPIQSHREKLDFLITKRADACVIHSQFVDRPGAENEIAGLEAMIGLVHEKGLLAGISTHRVSTVTQCEKKNYGVDLYLFPLNLSGHVYPGYRGRESVKERIRLVRETPKPFVLMKALASGRIPPDEGLPFVLENSKPGDLVSLGFGSIEEAEESLGIVEKILSNSG
jgi:hypothetical protein